MLPRGNPSTIAGGIIKRNPGDILRLDTPQLAEGGFITKFPTSRTGCLSVIDEDQFAVAFRTWIILDALSVQVLQKLDMNGGWIQQINFAAAHAHTCFFFVHVFNHVHFLMFCGSKFNTIVSGSSPILLEKRVQGFKGSRIQGFVF